MATRDHPMESWTETTTARERIETIATTLTEPRSVNWIKEQAEVGSWETTKSHLEHLVETGQLRTIDLDGEPRYEPDPMRAYLDEIQRLVVEHTKVELRDELAAIADEIGGWKTDYDVDSRSELEATLGDPELTPDQRRERRKVVRYWEENLQYRQLLSHALHLYDDLTAQDPADDQIQV